MASLRKRFLIGILWIAVIGLFGIHLILKNNRIILNRGQTKKLEPRFVGNEPTEKIISIHFDRLATDKDEESLLDETRDEGDTNDDDTTNYQNITTDDMFLNVLAGRPKIRSNPALEEKIKFKTKIDNLQTELEKLQKSNRQLKELSKRLIAQQNGKDFFPKLDPVIPWVFGITPTYTRYTQKAELVRLSQTLQHVTNFHWIVVEDSETNTKLVTNFLLDSGLSFTHLHVRTPSSMRRRKGQKHNKFHRGVEQRNLALNWIRKKIDSKKTSGVVYFIDDDNTYHKNIFEEIRWTKRVSAWPVAFTGGLRYQGPKVVNGRVVGFHTNWRPERKFCLDMAGFAVNIDVLIHDKAKAQFRHTAKRGHLEPTFLSEITTVEDLEPLADNCTKVLVWHTRTESPKDSIKGELGLKQIGTPSDPNIET